MKPFAAAFGALGVIWTALAAQTGQPPRVYVTATASALVAEGLALPAPTGSDAPVFQDVPAPSLQNAPNTTGYAQVTIAPWVNSNGSRFQRGISRAAYRTLPRGLAPLAAAEAFAFRVDALINPDAADVADLGNVLRFLKAHAQPPLPVLANIGVVDDGSAAMVEVLNMLTRRNLLYRVVSRPDPKLDLTIQLGSKDFPAGSAANPSDFAARVREKLGDDRRLVRIFGSTTLVAHLTGDTARERLFLVSYARNRGSQQDVRVRLLGRWPRASVAAYGADAAAAIVDLQAAGAASEFTLPTFNTLAIVDLRR